MTSETTYHLDVPSTYVREGAGEGKPLLLFAHGFADSAASFLRRTLPEPDPRFEILAPNGPFPMPQRVGNEWKDAYAWYFADFDAKRVRVHPNVAARAVAGLVKDLNLTARPKILVGFSQGGYFLPHLARELAEVRAFVVIGAGAQARFFDEYGLKSAPVHFLHGTADEVIPFSTAREGFEAIAGWNTGTFTPIPGMTHTINDEGRAAVKRLLGELV